MNSKDFRPGNYVQSTPLSIPRLQLTSDGITQLTAYGIYLLTDNKISYDELPISLDILKRFNFDFSNENKNYPALKLPISDSDVSKYLIISKDCDNEWCVFLDEIVKDGLYVPMQTVYEFLKDMIADGENVENFNYIHKKQSIWIRNIKYVHELQNIYNSFTGEELFFNDLKQINDVKTK